MSTASRPLRFLTAAGLFAVFLWYSNPREVGRALAGVEWRWMGAAVLLVLLDRALMAWRWIALLAPIAHGSRPPMRSLLRIFFVSTFLGTFLPGSIGADAVRTWGLAKAGVDAHEGVATVLMDRVLGVLSVVIAAIAGLMLAPELLGVRAVWIGLSAAAAACAAALALVFSPAAATVLLRLVSRAGSSRLDNLSGRLLAALRAYAGHNTLIAGVLAASVGVQVIRILQAWLLGLSLGITASLTAYFAFVPLILLIMLLPITFNGLGTSQAAFVWAFGRAGVAEPQAFALSVLFVALGIVGNLPGALIYGLSGATDTREARV